MELRAGVGGGGKRAGAVLLSGDSEGKRGVIVKQINAKTQRRKGAERILIRKAGREEARK